MVRAIDAQQVILQSSIAERVQQIQQQNPDMQQRYFALQLSEQDRLLKDQVNSSDEAEKAAIKEKEDRNSKRRGRHQPNKETPQLVAAEEGESTDEGEHINIKV
jgi:hypothetical protein